MRQIHGYLPIERCRLGLPRTRAGPSLTLTKEQSLPERCDCRPARDRYIFSHLLLRIPCPCRTSFPTAHLVLRWRAVAGPNSRCCPFAETVAGQSGEYTSRVPTTAERLSELPLSLI